ncbi:uncharacterized protein VTP21DRAFT_7654 [Calcarisporiella thermophila]|uniref:uncharacterized protein n=1 Tax=Calcarisporiella thermophila TaxID=911321 RepID=UPI0037449408
MPEFDRFYLGILASVVTSCFINIRVMLARPKLFSTRAGVAHFLSNIFALAAGLNLTLNESLQNDACTLELGFGCAFVHASKLLNHLILFWRCNAVTNHHPFVRYGFYILVAFKMAAVSSHCALMQPFYDAISKLCLDKLEPISTTLTFALDMSVDLSLTTLFMVKIYDQVRENGRYTYGPAVRMRRLFREYIYETVPMLVISMCLNGIIISNVLKDYTLILIYTDLILQLRLTNDLIVLNRLADDSSSSINGSSFHKEQSSLPKSNFHSNLSVEDFIRASTSL